MKKIIIPGPYYTENVGDYGLLKVLLDGLRDQLNEEIDVINLTRHIDKSFDEEFSLKSIKNLDYESKEESIGKWFNGFNAGDSISHLIKIRKEFENADLMIIPGPMLYDISFSFLRGPIPYYALMTMLCKFYNVPQMIYGLSIFEHKTDIAKEIVKFIVSNSQAITVRETSSKNYLIKIGVKESFIHVLPDPAVGLKPIENLVNTKLFLKKNQININNKEIVVISPRFFNWLWNDEEYEMFYKVLVELCDKMMEEFGVYLIFVPQATYNVDNKFTDDRFINFNIQNRLKNKESTYVMHERCTIEQLLGIYRISSFVVAMRRHALVFAASQETPFFALFPSGYPPVADFAEDINSDIIGTSIDDFNSNRIWGKLKSSWENKINIKEKLVPVIKEKREKVNKYISLAISLLNDRNL